MSANPLFRLSCSLASAAALVAAFPPFGLSWLCFLALAPLGELARRVSLPRAFVWGWGTGALANAGCFAFAWSALAATELPVLARLGLFVALALTNGLAYGLWAAAYRALCGLPGLAALVGGALALPLCEAVVWQPFPWSLAHALHDVAPAAQLADLVGARGLTAVVAFVGLAVGRALASPQPSLRAIARGLAPAAVVLAALVAYGYVRLAQVAGESDAASKLRLGVVEPGVARADGPERLRRKEALQARLARSLYARGAELVVLSETAVPERLPRELDRLPYFMEAFRVPLLVGAFTSEPTGALFNSAVLLASDGRVLGRYDKERLAVVGETVPFADGAPGEWLRAAAPDLAKLRAGGPSPLIRYEGHKLGLLICLEDILPELARRRVLEGAAVLVNLTSDGWFEGTAEPALHRTLATFRAIETRRALVRVVRGGASSLVWPTGETRAITLAGLPVAELWSVPLLDGRTVYVRVADLLGPVAGVALAALLVASRLRARRRRVPSPPPPSV